MHTVRSLSQGKDAHGTITEFLATNGLAGPDNDKTAWLAVDWVNWSAHGKSKWAGLTYIG